MIFPSTDNITLPVSSSRPAPPCTVTTSCVINPLVAPTSREVCDRKVEGRGKGTSPHLHKHKGFLKRRLNCETLPQKVAKLHFN